MFTNLAFFLGAVFFRSASFENALAHIKGMFFFQNGLLRPYMWKDFLWVFFFVSAGHILGFFIFERGKWQKISLWAELALYPLIVLVLALFTPENSTPFIYFQF